MSEENSNDEENNNDEEVIVHADGKDLINGKDYRLIELPYCSTIQYCNYNHDKYHVLHDVRKRLDAIYSEMILKVDWNILTDDKIPRKLDINFSLNIDEYY